MTRQWGEAETVQVSALQHYAYCPRQCALIHIERVFDENVHTLRGRLVHENVDQGGADMAGGVRTERSVPIWSERLGLTGKADLVEFPGGTPYPVEYKHGRLKKASFHADAVQLCAQGLCLEEMTGRPVPLGAVYYHSSRRRREAPLDGPLRRRTEEIIAQVRAMLLSGRTPPPVNDKRCTECSLRVSCVPEISGAAAINPFNPLPEP